MQTKRAAERAKLPLGEIPSFSFFFTLGALFALQQHDSFLDAQVYALYLLSGQFDSTSVRVIIPRRFRRRGQPFRHSLSKLAKGIIERGPKATGVGYLNHFYTPLDVCPLQRVLCLPSRPLILIKSKLVFYVLISASVATMEIGLQRTGHATDPYKLFAFETVFILSSAMTALVTWALGKE